MKECCVKQAKSYAPEDLASSAKYFEFRFFCFSCNTEWEIPLDLTLDLDCAQEVEDGLLPKAIDAINKRSN